MDTQRPFYKSTEFYISLFVITLGALLGSGVIGPDTVWSKLCGIVLEALAAVGYTVGRTIWKTSIVSAKPGWKCSEFWQSLIVGGLTLVQTMGILPVGSPAESIIATLLSALAPATYAASRGKVKAGALLPLLLLLVIPALSACTTTTQRFSIAQRTAESIRKAAKPILNLRCLDIADKCPTGKAEACKAWVECRDLRRAVYAAHDITQVAVATGLGYLASGDQSTADKMLTNATTALARLLELVKRYGLAEVQP